MTHAIILVVLGITATLAAQEKDESRSLDRIQRLEHSLGFAEARLARGLNELIWIERLRNTAIVDRVRFTGPPNTGTNKPGGTNDVIISACTFFPTRSARKLPLIVFVHGEIHGNMVSDEDVVIVRELVEQGYAVIAPDYRGSSGYGGDFWHQIDYGGLEVEDVWAGRNFMIENHPEIDAKRVGIIGWSHGGHIALMNALTHPEGFQAVYAGAPVTDLIARLKYRDADYGKLFAAPYHIGKTLAEAPDEYSLRSPVSHAAKLQAPLLIHANTSDDDVRLIEIEMMIEALQRAGKRFEHRIYTNAPGGHHFNRIDTRLARESRMEIYQFLGKHLKPPRPARSTKAR
jgi:dipeptidyl aminopeptidase/acylaminoacyl peptidase